MMFALPPGSSSSTNKCRKRPSCIMKETLSFGHTIIIFMHILLLKPILYLHKIRQVHRGNTFTPEKYRLTAVYLKRLYHRSSTPQSRQKEAMQLGNHSTPVLIQVHTTKVRALRICMGFALGTKTLLIPTAKNVCSNILCARQKPLFYETGK